MVKLFYLMTVFFNLYLFIISDCCHFYLQKYSTEIAVSSDMLQRTLIQNGKRN
jgi:hypothetical protein